MYTYHTIPYHTIPYHTIPYHDMTWHDMTWHYITLHYIYIYIYIYIVHMYNDTYVYIKIYIYMYYICTYSCKRCIHIRMCILYTYNTQMYYDVLMKYVLIHWSMTFLRFRLLGSTIKSREFQCFKVLCKCTQEPRIARVAVHGSHCCRGSLWSRREPELLEIAVRYPVDELPPRVQQIHVQNIPREKPWDALCKFIFSDQEKETWLPHVRSEQLSVKT